MNDSDKNFAVCIAMAIALLLGFTIGFLIADTVGYRRGQEDYINGVIKYEIRDGEVWEKMQKK